MCDHCGSKLGQARTICMDCRGKWSINFCEDPACAAATVGLEERDDLEKPHIPAHEVFKVYTVLHGPYHAMTETKAKKALKKARQLLGGRAFDTDFDTKGPAISPEPSGPVDAESAQDSDDTKNVAKPEEATETAEIVAPTCSHCKEKVFLSPPCWACVECGMFDASFFIHMSLTFISWLVYM